MGVYSIPQLTSYRLHKPESQGWTEYLGQTICSKHHRLVLKNVEVTLGRKMFTLTMNRVFMEQIQ